MRRFIANHQSFLTAILIVIALVAWMLSGQHETTAATATEANEDVIERVEAISVRTRTLTPKNVTREVILHGITEPSRSVTLRAEIEGRVVEVMVEKGEHVEAGDVIARVDTRERTASLLEAKATVQQRRLEHQAAVKLAAQNFQSETEVAAALAELEAAKAQQQRIEVEISNAIVRAPFDGVLDERPVEIGDYVAAGDPIARILDQEPMLIIGHVAQQKRQQIKIGADASAVLVTGDKLEGQVSFIAAEADAETRTFRVEIQVHEANGKTAAGVTGEIRIPTEGFVAHFLPTSLLSLDADDQLGVKTVNDESIVEFHQIEIVRASTEGLWVTGLPETVQVITVGQGFVRAGDKVIAVNETEIAQPAQPTKPADSSA